jgi:sugar lactone lactonase YvrE
MRRLALAAVCALAACSHVGKSRTVGTWHPGDPTWPEGAPTRVRWAGEIRLPADVGIRPGTFRRAWSWVTGAKRSDQLARPAALAVARDGRLAVSDMGRRSVHLYDPKQNEYRRLGGFDSPVGLAFDADGTLWVADSEARRVFPVDRRGRRGAPLDGFARPTGLAASADGAKLFVADTDAHQVHEVTLRTGARRTVGGRGTAPGQFNFPTFVATDPQGRVYVCDAMNFRFQVLDESLAPVRQMGDLGDGPGLFAKPKGAAVDTAGNLWTVEGLNERVQVFGPAGELLLVFGGSGTGKGRFWLPMGVAFQGNRLFIADTYNARVQVFETMSDNAVAAAAQSAGGSR